jgi:hypothetical protein
METKQTSSIGEYVKKYVSGLPVFNKKVLKNNIYKTTIPKV